MTVSADVEAAQMPNARPRASPSKAWVMRASEPGMSRAPAAPWSSRKSDQELERRCQPAQRRRQREPGQTERIDAAPAVVVAEGAGDDEQRGQDGEIAADHVGLALEHTDHRGGQLLPDPLERDPDEGPVQEHSSGSDDGGDEGPALASGHAREVSQHRRRVNKGFGLDSAGARTRGARRRR